jgi:hypothetical protein
VIRKIESDSNIYKSNGSLIVGRNAGAINFINHNLVEWGTKIRRITRRWFLDA